MTQPPNITRLEFVNESTVLNGGVLNGGQTSYALVKAEGMKRSSADAGLGDMEMDDSDSDSDSLSSAQQHALGLGGSQGNGLKPGKKTKGRVKIKMEFIENKLRRYTTFSKRKTGIMKKAYELSTLTGTQVMLLVASETGHVYTFATRKLQPMITSESGKALIQTCLNSPDTPPTAPGAQQAVEQRMNPTGFEETELSYAVGDEEGQKMPESMVSAKSTSGGYCHIQQPPSQSPSPVSASPSPAMNPTVSSPQTVSMTAYVTPTTTTAQSSPKPTNLSMHLPSGSIAVLPHGGEAQSILNYMQGGYTTGLPPGTPISVSQSSGSGQQQQQAVYRFPNTQQMVSIQGIPQTHAQNLVKSTESSSSSSTSSSQQQQSQQQAQQQQQQQSQQQQSITMIQGSQGQPIMYHTSQGLVYATAAGTSVGATLPEGIILNLPQSSPLQLTQDQQTGGTIQTGPGGQQYITIPVPLPLAHGGSTQQMFHPMLAQTGTQSSTADPNRSPVDRTGKR